MDDLDHYALRHGLPRWCAPLMLIIHRESWPIILYRYRHFVFLHIHIILLRQILTILGFILDWFVRWITTINISYKAEIGRGLYIPHEGNITISHHSKVGDFCTIHQGVTLGGAGRGGKYGGPTIGDRCFIGTNATVVGKIFVGNNVAIGANAFVCKDVPNNSVMAAPMAIKISDKGSFGTIHIRNEKLYN